MLTEGCGVNHHSRARIPLFPQINYRHGREYKWGGSFKTEKPLSYMREGDAGPNPVRSAKYAQMVKWLKPNP